MTGLTIQALHWSRLPDLAGVAPLDESDLACMTELRDVLARHERLERFALHLVHRHFELEAGEVLVEYSDPQAREQQLRVEPAGAPALRDAVPTTWLLATGQPQVMCVCAARSGQGHLGRHESTPRPR